MRKPIYDVMKFRDLKEMLQKSGEVYGDRPAYIFKTEEEGKFREITHKEFRNDINNLDEKINSSFGINIKLPVDNINKWKNQFKI